MKKNLLKIIASTVLISFGLAVVGCGNEESKTANPDKIVKVGLLHSLSGTMSFSETPVRDAEKLAIDEINAEGGVLGRKIEIVEEDGKSDPQVFAEKAQNLLTKGGVVTIFGCWTSASRKAVVPVVERNNSLLWYPVQYEGFESSNNVVYTGSTLNQQIIPSIDYLLRNGRKKMFLLGNDYIFPKIANKVIKAQLIAKGGECVGEEYTPLGHTDYSDIIEHIKAANPDIIINTLNGDTNIGFFRQLKASENSVSKIPVMSFSIAETEIQYIDPTNLADHVVAWSYFETLDNERNRKFVSAFKKSYGNAKVTDDPMEAAYNSVYLWKAAVEKAKSFETEKVREALIDLNLYSPEGEIKISGKSQHLYRQLLIGRINPNGLVDIIEIIPSIQPDPYLETYDWAKNITLED